MYIFYFRFLLSFLDFLWVFEFCGKPSVLTMSSQDKIFKKEQRKSAFVAILWQIDDHYL